MYNIFFIHSMVEGHLDCFRFLAIKNKAKVFVVIWRNFGVFVQEFYSWTLWQVYLRNCHTDFHSDRTSLHSTSNGQVDGSSISTPAWTVTCVTDLNHSDRSKVESQSHLDFTFPQWIRTLNISLSVSQPFEIPLLRILCLGMYPIF